MQETKLNCWESEQCGLEPGGRNVAGRSVCPAAVEQHADGIHHGRNAGRCCWVVAGTLCRNTVQGDYATKIVGCQRCDFYTAVRKEEHNSFRVFSDIMHEMRRRASDAK
jgi:hypothetical protein